MIGRVCAGDIGGSRRWKRNEIYIEICQRAKDLRHILHVGMAAVHRLEGIHGNAIGKWMARNLIFHQLGVRYTRERSRSPSRNKCGMLRRLHNFICVNLVSRHMLQMQRSRSALPLRLRLNRRHWRN